MKKINVLKLMMVMTIIISSVCNAQTSKPWGSAPKEIKQSAKLKPGYLAGQTQFNKSQRK